MSIDSNTTERQRACVFSVSPLTSCIKYINGVWEYRTKLIWRGLEGKEWGCDCNCWKERQNKEIRNERNRKKSIRLLQIPANPPQTHLLQIPCFPSWKSLLCKDLKVPVVSILFTPCTPPHPSPFHRCPHVSVPQCFFPSLSCPSCMLLPLLCVSVCWLSHEPWQCIQKHALGFIWIYRVH